MPTWKTSSLKAHVLNAFRIAPQYQSFSTAIGAPLLLNLTFQQNNISDGQELHLRLTLDGGVGRKVQKPHLKESEAKLKFIKKRGETLKGYLEECETKSNITPPEVLPLVQAMMNRMDEIKRKVSQGEDVLIESLEGLADDQLASLSDIFKYRKGEYTEQKIVKGAYVLIPEMVQMDEYVNHIIKHKNLVVADFLTSYANTFCASKAGNIQYDNDRFSEAVKETIKYRDRLRRSAPSATDNGQGSEQEDANRCVLM
eukprot:Skav216314  [mRNA]  locus=scaffold3892:6008:6775:- [translate_table: standard]